MPARAVVVWVGLVALLATLSSSPGASPSTAQATLMGVAVAFVVGVGARSSLLLAAVRAGRLPVAGDGAGEWAPLLVGGVAAVLAAVVVAVVAGAAATGAAGVIALAGLIAVVVALAWPHAVALRASSSSLWAFLGRGAALAAVMAAALGAVVAVGRFGLDGEVTPGAFSRVLAGTFLCDALLGVGGFVRADVGLRCGLVQVGKPVVPDAPGPVLLALVLAAPTVLLLPSVAPPLSATTAVAIKIVAGAVVGGLLHLAGGVRGAKRALS
jgi:hypothetical protein